MSTKKMLIFFLALIYSNNFVKAQDFLDSIFFDNNIRSISVRKDTVFFITQKGIFFQVNDSKVDTFNNLVGDFYHLLDINNQKFLFGVNSISLVDSMRAKELLKFDGIKPIASIKSVCVDKFGSIYAAASHGIIYKILINDNNKIDTISRTFPDLFIHELFYDNLGRVWVSTENGAYFTMDSDPLFQFKKLDPIKDPIYSIRQIDNYIYFAGAGKIWKYPESLKGRINENYLCIDESIKKIFFFDNHFWFLGKSVIGFFENKINQKYSKIKAGNIETTYATCVATDNKKQKIYVGTEGKGVFVYQTKDLLLNTQCFSCDSIQKVGTHKGTIYTKSYNLGVGRKIELSWDMDDIPDRIQVIEGRKITGRKLYDSGFKKKKGVIKKTLKKDPFILILITSNKEKDTRWEYKIRCLN